MVAIFTIGFATVILSFNIISVKAARYLRSVGLNIFIVTVSFAVPISYVYIHG